MNDIFNSSAEYKKTFNQGLIELATDDSLGTFILAMANATFDQAIYKEIKTSLKENLNKIILNVSPKVKKSMKLTKIYWFSLK